MNSHILTPDLARQAFEMILPSVSSIMARSITNRRAFHALVIDPTVAYQENRPLPVVFQYSHGKDGWEYEFDHIALSKAAVTWRTGKPSIEVATQAPFLYIKGDTIFGGSAINNGLITACSGIQWYFDYMISQWFGSACQALSIARVEELKKQDRDFLV